MVAHIESREQAARWHRRGYDVVRATDRYIAFVRIWGGAVSAEEADALVADFYRSEARLLRQAGISAEDPDFFRIDAAARQHEWR